jgi:putative ABC transport system substrate-binding protein
MRRREFITLLCSTAIAQPIAALAQQAGKIYRVGFIVTTSPVSEMIGPKPIHLPTRVFLQGMRALGYVEGQNLILERRSAEGRFEQFGGIVAELVGLKADVIVTIGNPMTRAAKAVTTVVPIVTAVINDPVSEGIVQSLARPGGNITGLTNSAGPEIEAKRLELLREMLPRVSRIAYLGNQQDNDWESANGKSVRTAAQALGVTLALAESKPRQYTDAFTQISRNQAEAIFVSRTPAAYADLALIVDFANQTRLPSMFAWREATELGGLMSYGLNQVDHYRHVAIILDKILKGAKPADLPIEQPTKFELVINLKSAQALGLSVPPTLLARADELIE